MTGLGSIYAREGYTIVQALLDRSTVESCREHLSAVSAAAPVHTRILAVAVDRDPFAERLASDRRLAGLAGRLLGDREVECFGFTYVVKEAGGGPSALWHQDGEPWRTRFGIEEAVTLWVALDDVDGSNGALVVIPGSHTEPARPLLPAAAGSESGGLFGAGIDPGPLDSTRVVTLVMSPGDVSAHHPCLIHGSGPNTSERERRALALRYRPE